MSQVDWSAVDWSKSNYDLSAELGVAYSTVTYNRRKAGMAAPVNVRRIQPEHIRLRNEFIKRQRELGFSATDIHQMLLNKGYDITLRWVQALTKRLGVNRLPRLQTDRWRVSWDDVDWSKTDTEIAEEVGVHLSSVGRMRRKFDELGLSGREEV